MLAPLCRAVPAEDLILAARFESNKAELDKMPEGVCRVRLDYRDPQSRAAFLDGLDCWHDIAWCVLWVHSGSQGFSADVMTTLAAGRPAARIIHVFGSTADPGPLADLAARLGIEFSAVRLGQVKDKNGARWMTHGEISARTGAALARTYPVLGEIKSF